MTRRHDPATWLPLTTEQALVLTDTLEALLRAIYSMHGDAIADLRARLGIETPIPPDAIVADSPDASDDDIDF